MAHKKHRRIIDAVLDELKSDCISIGTYGLKVEQNERETDLTETLLISIDSILFCLLTGFSIWTILAQTHILMGWSFQTLVNTYLGFFVIQCLICFYYLYTRIHELLAVCSKPEYLFLFGLCIAGLFLATGWIRPDADDFNYLGGRVVYWVDNPETALDLTYHNYALLPFPIRNNLLFFQAIDLLPGFFKLIFNINLLDFYYIILPAFTGALIPLIWYTVIRSFVLSRSAILLGVLAIMLYLCMDGTVHRSLGNFAFVRIWQCKAIYISCCIPLFVGWSVKFFNNPTRSHFLRLLILGIATTGLTATTFPLTMFLTISMCSGFLLSHGISKMTIKKISLYLLAQGGILISGLGAVLFMEKKGIEILGFKSGAPKTFLAQLEAVFGTGVSFTIVILILSLLAVMILADRKSRLFIVGWLMFGMIVLYNPWTMPFITKYITSESIYWRIFYVSPFPLSLGLTAAFLAERRGLTFRKLLTYSWICPIILVSYSWAFPKQSVYGELPFLPFHYKINARIEQDVRFIIQNTPPGPILAPKEYRPYISVFDNQRPLILGRLWFITIEATLHNMKALSDSRLKASQTSEKNQPVFIPDFEKALTDGVTNVVINRQKMNNNEVIDALKKHHFTLRAEKPSFGIYVKADS